MDDELRPTQALGADPAAERALAEAGLMPVADYVGSRPETLDTYLAGAAHCIERARTEFAGGHKIAGRLEILQAHHLLDRAYSDARA